MCAWVHLELGVSGSGCDKVWNVCFSFSYCLCKHCQTSLFENLWKHVLWEYGYYILYKLKRSSAKHRVRAHLCSSIVEFMDHATVSRSSEHDNQMWNIVLEIGNLEGRGALVTLWTELSESFGGHKMVIVCSVCVLQPPINNSNCIRQSLSTRILFM